MREGGCTEEYDDSSILQTTGAHITLLVHVVGMAPKDVKKGHFAVMAVQGGKAQRFVVGLSCLANPDFVRLLDKTQEEHGFVQRGTLTLFCSPSELGSILAQQWKGKRSESLLPSGLLLRRAWRRVAANLETRVIRWYPYLYFFSMFLEASFCFQGYN
ncbi:hypothetical protein EJ110_NYTH12780 [Nymphaea thermarum]|nr:hypothetical protein EJ110_NYTH12780 [Nymphaea thermarum]